MTLRLLPLLVLVALVPSAGAQMLPSGVWTGTLTDADGDTHAVETDIQRCADGFKMALDVGGRTAEVPEDAPATWERGRLRFTTSRLRLPGTFLPRAMTCDLASGDDGVLSGTCAIGSDRVRLRLSPPSDGTFGCD
ncbi:hypothetical protein [Rubrivirga marina]|uniref:Uncharacterized protein n=1 Tax=Rubrivirga marina TaxID=1196024 RepID=A0A271J5Q0_9BACT|nr:hypothetical protein [Rubrivirga marina]PAP78577.1 hypothetical protein BSZ37_20170 [Rubrivirga marina]